jgi:hypothetical protein
VHFHADGGIADDLRPARVVAQIEEDQIAEVAADIHPAGQENRLPGVFFAKLTAIVRSLSITEKIKFQVHRRMENYELRINDERGHAQLSIRAFNS